MLRAAGMAKRPITNELLELTVATKVSEGVDPFAIRALVYKFAYKEPRRDQVEEAVSFLWIEDIPLHFRGEFLTALIDLPGRPQPVLQETRKNLTIGSKPRLSAASDLWNTVRASFSVFPFNPPL